ncbi:MAG: hypothetical protein ABSG78_05690 [Verrucomicrobiota bacterium]|jgi:antitoxin (DNA-binding transcriptional repressor) of toxin-antitoxin stability system
MKRTPISVTQAARHFADCVNRVHYQNVTFVLLKNGSPVAQLGPVDQKTGLGRNLAESLSRTTLSDKEGRAWRRDVQTARKTLHDKLGRR